MTDYAEIRELLLQKKYDEIVTLGDAAIPHLTAALKDKTWKVRSAAANALGETRDASIVPPLVAALKDRSVKVRGRVVKALAKIGEPAVPALTAALNHKSYEARISAVSALGDIGGASVVPSLIVALKGAISGSYAAWALVRRGKSVIPELLDALKDADRDDDGRHHASFALEKIAEETDIDLKAVKNALKEYVDSVERKGDSNEITKAKMEAARYYAQISQAVTKFRAGLFKEDGVILVGELPRPPRDKTYRSGARRSFA